MSPWRVTSDGSVWAWGDNSEGALWNGPYVSIVVRDPERIPGFSGVVSVAAGARSHCLALLVDGTVAAWGYDSRATSATAIPPPTASCARPGRRPRPRGRPRRGRSDSFAVKSDGTSGPGVRTTTASWAGAQRPRAWAGDAGPPDAAQGPGVERRHGGRGRPAPRAGSHERRLTVGLGRRRRLATRGGATATCTTSDGAEPCSLAPHRSPACRARPALVRPTTTAWRSSVEERQPPRHQPHSSQHTYVDPSHSYALGAPASWTSTPTKAFDLFVRSATRKHRDRRHQRLYLQSWRRPDPAGPAELRQFLRHPCRLADADHRSPCWHDLLLSAYPPTALPMGRSASPSWKKRMVIAASAW